jgi:hypothetical protein
VGAAQSVSQVPQWLASVAVFTQDEPQTVPEHVLAHFVGDAEASQIASVPVHDVVQLPQWSAVSSAVSQPSLGSPLQSPHPAAHDEAGKAQAPPWQLTSPTTCERLVQSFEQEPHVEGWERSVVHPEPPPAQSAKPLSHWYEQSPAEQLALFATTPGSAVQSFEHEPQVWTSAGAAQLPAAPHVS